MPQDRFSKDVLLTLGNSWNCHCFLYYHKWRAFYPRDHRGFQSSMKNTAHGCGLYIDSCLEEEGLNMWKKSLIGPQIFCSNLSPLLTPEILSQWINLSVKVSSSTCNIAVLNLLLWNSVSNHKIRVFKNKSYSVYSKNLCTS